MIAVALAATLVLGAREGRAESDDGKEPVRIGTDLAPGCPDGPFFYQQVRSRTRHVRLARGGETARELRVVVKTEGVTFRGRLEVQTRDGASSSREVSGRRCNEVLSALAFVAALGIDPNASLTSTAVRRPSTTRSAPARPVSSSPRPRSTRARCGGRELRGRPSLAHSSKVACSSGKASAALHLSRVKLDIWR